MVVKEISKLQKKIKNPNHIYIYIFLSFFSSVVPYCNNDFHKTQFEDDFVLFITKDLHLLLSFIEAAFFQKIASKAKSSTRFSIKTKGET
jgi:hypothetical protein